MRKLLYSFLFFISSKSFFKRLCKPSLSLLCVGMFFVVSIGFSQNTWIGGTGNNAAQRVNWGRSQNWSSGNVPSATDNVIIPSATNSPVISASAVCATLTIQTGGVLTVSEALAVGGATNISGTLTVGATSGTKRFTGLVTINSGGVWNNSASSAINFRGGITNNGGFTSGTAIQTFDTNAQSIIGNISISSVTVTGVILNNNGILTISSALAGNGTLTNNVGTTLNIGGTSTITNLGATAVGNTVNYNGSGNQSIKTTTYSNLTISGNGSKTAAASLTINNDFTLNGGTFVANNGTSYTHSILGNYTQTGGVFDFNGGTSGVSNVNIGGNFTNTVGAGSITTIGAVQNGIFNFNGTGIQTLNMPTDAAAIWVKYKVNTGSTLKLASDLTLNTALTSDTDPWMGELNVSGTIDLGTFKIVPSGGRGNGSGTAKFVLNSGATLITANSNGINGAVPVSGSMTRTFSTGADYIFNGTVSQVTSTGLPSTVNNLTISNTHSSGVTLSQATTVTKNFSVLGGSIANLNTFTHSTATLMLGGAVMIPGTWGSTGSAAANKNDTFFVSTASGIINNTCTSPTITVQPNDLTICEGTSGTFSVTSSTTGVSYQWQYSLNGTSWTNIDASLSANLSGYTTRVLSLNNTPVGWNGYSVRCVVYNGLCAVNSNSKLLTVNPVHTISAGANRSVCQNSAITPIALTLGGGATDAVVTGLPSGVTSSVTGNTLTISGNPTAIGVFNYNVTTTGNSCATATTTGTITVGIGNNIITYNNGNSNSVCVNVDENQTAIFTAPAGTYFNTVSFASYGSPTGSCGAFQINYVCHSAVKSQSYTESRLLGNTGTIEVIANNENFDDPCVGTFKAYKAVARYSEAICAGTIPGQISGSAPTGGGTYAYFWEMSTTSSTSGFSAAPGTNNSQNYIPTAQVTTDTWFRRTVTSGGTCPNVSAVVLIKVNPSPTLTGASQSASVCSGSVATINLSGLLAGSTSTISYSINSVAQTPITSIVASSTGTASFTTPALTTANNGQTLQITEVTTTSSTPNCSLSFSINVTLAVNPTPTLTGASQPLSVCTGSAATINLTGLLAGSTSTISYSINSVTQTPITSVVATAGGTASFTTPALTYANNGQTLRITQITTTSSTPNCSSAFTRDVTLSVNAIPTTPTITKNNNASCNTLGSITLSDLPADWTVNQTGATTLPKSYPGPGASLAIQDLVADTYSFTVTNNATGCTSSAVNVTIADTSSNTEWDATGWTNGEPDGSKSVTISYVTASHQPFTIAKPNIQACSLTITATSDVIIPDGVTLTITNKVTSNGKLVFENGSSLLQTTNVKNDGDIVYKRTTKINRFDLTYWSSPVTGEPDTFKMKDLSSETLFDKFFTYSPTGGWATNMYGMAEMEPGKGYSIRGPQSFDSQTAANFTGEFKGRPNNGDITVPSVVPDKWFLLGNPYPSAIDVDALWDANVDQLGALYFWTHVAPPTKAPGDNTYRYTSNDYVVYTASGGTVVGGTKSFDGFIAAGQGFFARPKTTEIHFNNDMRRGSSVNGSFFKVASKSKSIERNRIWLNMVNNEGAFKQILVGYIEGATNNVDFNYDAPTIAGNSYLDFYSLNETKKLTIQGRALPFENTDLVPLGYKTTVAGDFTIGIDHGDGFFGKQEVYLEDKTTGKTINLRNENYTFSTLVGTFTERFVLRYTGKTLGTDDLENLENSVLISVKNKTVSITCSKETIKDVTIFNVGGQLVYSKNKVNSSELQITNLHSSDQVLLVKVTLENGSTVTKKVIFSNL